MATIFFDTCAIRSLMKRKIPADYIKSKLGSFHTIVVGPHTLVECMKNYTNRDECINTFLYVDALKPEYTLSARQFLEMEAIKLKSGKEFSYFCTIQEKQFISQFCEKLVSQVSEGVFKGLVDEYDSKIKSFKSAWYAQKSNIKEYGSLYANVFSADEVKQLKSMQNSSVAFHERVEKIQPTEKIIDVFIEHFLANAINLSVFDVQKFFQNQAAFPAMRTYWRSIILLGDNTIYGNSPAEDKFTDAIQFTEAAYSTTFLSAEIDLVDIQKPKCRGKKYNPDIGLLDLCDFLENISQIV